MAPGVGRRFYIDAWSRRNRDKTCRFLIDTHKKFLVKRCSLAGRSPESEVGVRDFNIVIVHEVITGVVESGLKALGKSDVGIPQILALSTTLDAEITNLTNGNPIDFQALQDTIEQAIADA